MTKDEAFNAGCEARLRGDPIDENPCDDVVARSWWTAGYMDIHRWWGIWAKNPKKLPEVKCNP